MPSWRLILKRVKEPLFLDEPSVGDREASMAVPGHKAGTAGRVRVSKESHSRHATGSLPERHHLQARKRIRLQWIEKA